MGSNLGTLIGTGVGGLGGLALGNPLMGATLGGSIGSLFNKGDKTELEDLRTPEQKAAAQLLQQLAMTGSGGGINLGDAYSGSLGSYDTSGIQNAYNQLMSLYSGGGGMGAASDVYTRMANNKFNPDDPSSGYAAFSRQLAKAGKESDDALNREAAITGNRFGTAILGKKADLAADLANQRGMYLADLYNQSENRALQGAAGLQSLAGQQANIAQNAAQLKIQEQAIKDQQAKDALNEYKRQRSEVLGRINMLQTEADRNPYLGISSLTNSSPFSELANSVLGGVGTQVGSNIGTWISDLFKTAPKTTSNAPTYSSSPFSSTPFSLSSYNAGSAALGGL